MASGAKATVGENIASGAADNCAGVNIGTVNNTELACAGGVLTATVDTENTSVGDVDIILTPTQGATGVVWVCTTGSDPKYVPAECR
ncbi:MAG: pilin [Desulfobacterales bacterium]|nr:pilin [Desulfobacterales bacterium]